MTNSEWAGVGNLVYDILSMVYGARRPHFEEQARQRDCSLEQLASAAITSAVREQVEAAPGKMHRRGSRIGGAEAQAARRARRDS